MTAHPDRGGIDAYAAAGPALRNAIGPHWRDKIVNVNGIKTQLADWCACPNGRLIDLYADIFQQIKPLSRGTTNVTIDW